MANEGGVLSLPVAGIADTRLIEGGGVAGALVAGAVVAGAVVAGAVVAGAVVAGAVVTGVDCCSLVGAALCEPLVNTNPAARPPPIRTVIAAAATIT